jgi:hypothetical protein
VSCARTACRGRGKARGPELLEWPKLAAPLPRGHGVRSLEHLVDAVACLFVRERSARGETPGTRPADLGAVGSVELRDPATVERVVSTLDELEVT